MAPPTLALDESVRRMQLHNISEMNEYEQKSYIAPTAKQNVLSLTQRIQNDDLRQAIQFEFKKLVNEYDQLISVLQQRSDVLEQEYEKLKFNEEHNQRRYEKAVREMQFFKRKCEKTSAELSSFDIPSSPPPSSLSSGESHHFMLPPSSLPPLPSPLTVNPISRSSSSSSSLSNPTELSPPPPPTFRTRQVTNPSIHSSSTTSSTESPVDIQRKLSLVSPSDPNPNRNTTVPSQATLNSSIIQQRKVDPLTFGGSDSFWETIAKSTDSNIEKMISNFLRRGGSPNTAKQSSSYKSIKYGYGLIHAVIALKAFSSLELLLAQGANPNALTLGQVEDDKVTPIYLASSLGWLQGLEALVEAGGDITLAKGAGIKNKTSLHVAAENCHITAVEYIVARTPPQYHSQLDSLGSNALHYAAVSGHTDLLLFLIQYCHLNVEQVDIKGETPLHWASRYGHLEAASFLIERCGADFNAYTVKKSSTPFDLAKQGNHKRLVEYYKKIGAVSTKKMEKKKQEEIAKEVPVHLHSTLSKNGLFGF